MRIGAGRRGTFCAHPGCGGVPQAEKPAVTRRAVGDLLGAPKKGK
jgi:hypothetical protein